MKTVILCGGRGTRAYPLTAEVPKPLLLVGGQPVLRHVMDIYAGQGWTEFVLAAGYRADLVAEFAEELPADWAVEVVNTGEDTNTGGRVARVRDRVGDSFFLTYGDGVADIDLTALAQFHHGHPGAATVTTVPLPSPYGTLVRDDAGRVREFREKPRLRDHWINAGFMAMDARAFDWWAGEDLERDVLPALGGAGELFAYVHEGFWRSMDTHKDALELTALCGSSDDEEGGRPPWKRFATPAS